MGWMFRCVFRTPFARAEVADKLRTHGNDAKLKNFIAESLPEHPRNARDPQSTLAHARPMGLIVEAKIGHLRCEGTIGVPKEGEPRKSARNAKEPNWLLGFFAIFVFFCGKGSGGLEVLFIVSFSPSVSLFVDHFADATCGRKFSMTHTSLTPSSQP